MAKKNNANKGARKPAHELLVEVLNQNGLGFFVRKQEVRYMEDNGLVIEPPKVIIYYKDEVPADQAPKEKLDLPKE